METLFKKLAFGSAIALMAAATSCTQPQSSNSYLVEGTVADSSANGRTIFIRKFDNNQIVDSATVQNNRFAFKGSIDTAHYCYIDVNRKEFGNLIIEPGHIIVRMNNYMNPASGTPLNEEMVRIRQAQDSIQQEMAQKREKLAEQYPNKEEYDQQLQTFNQQRHKSMVEMTRSFLASHSNDAVGYLLMHTPFLEDIPVEDKWAFLQEFGPWLKSTRKAQQMISLVEKEKTSQVGMPFVNVEGVDEKGKKIALSDFAGKGNYVLVDIWATWCRPCRAEIPNIARLYQKYHQKGLTVVGIYTWDKASNLPRALKEEKISWPQIVDVESNAADKYGVDGIPFIFLLSPEGVILERGLRGEKMIRTVEKYLSK